MKVQVVFNELVPYIYIELMFVSSYSRSGTVQSAFDSLAHLVLIIVLFVGFIFIARRGN